jgi:hypothetical protein
MRGQTAHDGWEKTLIVWRAMEEAVKKGFVRNLGEKNLTG